MAACIWIQIKAKKLALVNSNRLTDFMECVSVCVFARTHACAQVLKVNMDYEHKT